VDMVLLVKVLKELVSRRMPWLEEEEPSVDMVLLVILLLEELD